MQHREVRRMSWITLKTLPHDYSSIEVVDMRSTLPVNPKGGWEDIKPPRNLDKLTRVILHHDGMSKASVKNQSDETLMKNIATGHINSKKNRANGDGGFPYHLFIRSGKVYITNNMAAFVYGVASNNDYTIHICVAGDYKNHDVLTEADRRALHVAILIAKGSMTHYKDMKGHSDLTATSCPGYSVKLIENEIIQLESEIAQLTQPETQAELAYKIANEITYRYNMFAHGKTHTGETANDGQRSWALQQVLKLEPELRKLGWIK